jgi:hypothetical protein
MRDPGSRLFTPDTTDIATDTDYEFGEDGPISGQENPGHDYGHIGPEEVIPSTKSTRTT